MLLFAFVLLVVALDLLQRWIGRHVQGIGVLLFNSSYAGMALLWFVLLPGVVLHEISHWLMARLLGVPTGRLCLTPSLQGKQVVWLGGGATHRSPARQPGRRGSFLLAPWRCLPSVTGFSTRPACLAWECNEGQHRGPARRRLPG